MPVSSRLYRDYTDLEEMRRFLIKARGRAGHEGGYFHVGDLIWRLFGFHWFQPKKDICLWFNESDTMIGFAWYYAQLQAVDLQVYPRRHPALLEREMLAWAETRAGADAPAAERPFLTTTALETDTERTQLLTELGFSRQNYFYYHFLRPLTSPPTLSPLPPGFTIRHITPADLEARAAVHRAAFPGSQLTADIYRGLLQAPGYIPELDLVVVTPDNTFAAFCTGWLDPVNRIGEFEPVGTHPDFRRQGLAQAVQQAGLQRLKAFGAEAVLVYARSYNTAAKNLYQSLNFAIINRNFDYTKRLS